MVGAVICDSLLGWLSTVLVKIRSKVGIIAKVSGEMVVGSDL